MQNSNVLNNELEEDISLEIMRELPSDTLSLLIYDSIINTDSMEFLNMVNIQKDKINILVAPTYNDKIILINAITMCLSLIDDFDSKDIETIIKSILDVYNVSHLEYTKADDINFYEALITPRNQKYFEHLKFLSDICVATITDKLKNTLSLNNNEKIKLKTQLLVYASVWFDMDKYLRYLYYKYE